MDITRFSSGDQNEAGVCSVPRMQLALRRSLAGTVFHPRYNQGESAGGEYYIVVLSTGMEQLQRATGGCEAQLLGHGLQFRGNYTFAKNLDNGSGMGIPSVSANTPAFVSVPSAPTGLRTRGHG